jgi:hypothetical protein
MAGDHLSGQHALNLVLRRYRLYCVSDRTGNPGKFAFSSTNASQEDALMAWFARSMAKLIDRVSPSSPWLQMLRVSSMQRASLPSVAVSTSSESIAVNARITGLSKMLELEFDHYAGHEQFYLDVANDAELSGWELDRLLFNFKGKVLEGLRG